MTASTRRAALGAILATPLASMPAVATMPAVSAEEAALLAIGPQLVRLLNEHDRLWKPVAAAFAVYEKASAHVRPTDHEARWRTPEFQAYLALRRPADPIAEEADALYDPFWNIPLATLPAILLRHRYGMSFETFRDDAVQDLDRLCREGWLCA